MDLSCPKTRFQDTVTKSDARLMSTAPSLPSVKLLWSIQTRVEYWTLMASSSQPRKVMLRMMTFEASETLRPQPEMVAPELPRMLLLEPTRSMPEQEIVPETRITAAFVPEIALVSADALVTVVVEPPL